MRPLAATMFAALLACGGPAGAAAAEQKIALVVGNAAYPTAALRNPVNDASAIAAKLQALGFEVTLRKDVTQRELTRAISQFGQAMKPGSVALFYYAGHGMQVRGRNFLVPVDADIATEASVRSEAVDLDLLLEQLGPARLAMVILDACRNNPFEGKFRSTRGSGLAQVDAPKGTLIAYATAPGKVASDGDGRNGLYTSELLRALDQPGLKVEEIFKAVRVNVARTSGNEQIPWESSSLTGDFFFRAPVEVRAAAQQERDTLLKTVTDESARRDKEAMELKREMEKLRAEILALKGASTVPAAPPPAAPATKAAPSKAAAPAKSTQPTGNGAAQKAPAAAVPIPELDYAAKPIEQDLALGIVPQSWKSQRALLEARKGTLTYAKAMALLLGVEAPESLDELVRTEASLKRMPYESALVLGVTLNGGICWATPNRFNNPRFAAETGLDTCTQRCGTRDHCRVVMVNGDFREDAFVEFAGGLGKRGVRGVREGIFKDLPRKK